MIKELSYESVHLAVNLFAEKEAMTLGLNLDPVAPAYMQLSNYLSKIIKAIPRKVTISKKFTIPKDCLLGYKNLVKKIKIGQDINAHLSKGIENTMFSDRFLDDYGCVHFHLGSTLERGYIKRTGPVALAFVTDQEIFFIETKFHGNDYPYTWTDKSVLEILHKERPHFIARNKVSTLKDISPSISNAETIKNLRSNGYGFGVTLNDGTVYMPSKFGPVSVKSSNKKKTSTLASEHLQRLMHATREIYFLLNKYVREFKLKNNCIIMNIEIMDLVSDKYDPLRISQCDIQIHYLKEFSISVHKNSFYR
jgi:hypothetical protein